jgi:hypothetical protein
VGSYMCDCPDGYKLRGRKNSGRCIGKNELEEIKGILIAP